MPDPLAQNASPTNEKSWTGALSAWGVALQRTGQYSLKTLSPGNTITYGWNRLVGTATLNGANVNVDMQASVQYTSGNGPFSGFVTFTFADGSTIGVSVQGITTAQSNTTDATCWSTLGVIGGTGTYVNVKGSGTFTGTRQAALGGQVQSTFDLDLDGIS